MGYTTELCVNLAYKYSNDVIHAQHGCLSLPDFIAVPDKHSVSEGKFGVFRLDVWRHQLYR